MVYPAFFCRPERLCPQYSAKGLLRPFNGRCAFIVEAVLGLESSRGLGRNTQACTWAARGMGLDHPQVPPALHGDGWQPERWCNRPKRRIRLLFGHAVHSVPCLARRHRWVLLVLAAPAHEYLAGRGLGVGKTLVALGLFKGGQGLVPLHVAV